MPAEAVWRATAGLAALLMIRLAVTRPEVVGPTGSAAHLLPARQTRLNAQQVLLACQNRPKGVAATRIKR